VRSKRAAGQISIDAPLARGLRAGAGGEGEMQRVRPRLVMAGLLALVGGMLLAASASSYAAPTAASATSAAHKCVVATGSGDAAFVRNFNPFQASAQVARDFTAGAIYENLVVSTAFGGGHIYNMLAKRITYSKDGKTITITVQPNVKWSDGKPLTARDVLYSLTIGRKSKFADRIGLTANSSNIASIKLAGPGQVAIHFKQADSTFVGSQLSNVWIVPQHVWSKVSDVEKFANTNPVGSGPFTQVTRFNSQDYVLSKNPNYWQKGLPKVQCVERIAAASNDAALLQIVNGDADWSHNFVPNIESAYQSHDPKHYHNSYLTTNLPIGLMFDTTKYPYSLTAFRKGVSQAIDRQKVSKLGEYGYAPATSALGIEFMYPNWVDPGVKAEAKKLATYDQAAAKKTFTDAGFTYKSGNLYDPKGDRVGFQIHVIGGWSDWVASLQIISKNLQDVGIDASVKLEPDWGAWQPNAMSTKFVTLLWTFGNNDMTPYAYFYSIMDPSQNLGAGVDASATGNWFHFSDPQAASLLNQFKGTLDTAKQKQVAYKLEGLFLDKFPYIPLFVGPRWSTYSTKYFTGFVSWQDQYVDPIFSTWNQVEKILLNLRPVGQAT
jgi:peptide/nickel transport system substrate-binding protein